MAGAWSPLAAVASSCAAWGTRAARLLDQIEYIGCPCRTGDLGRTRPARVLAGLTSIEPSE
eukprot:10804590-Alexandrium_andersonii.AAC.1